jgi:hypothetical protein
MSVWHGLAVVGAGAVGGTIGWFVGLALCPDWGDLGIGAVPWMIGGAAVGAAGGVFIAGTVLA